MRCGDSVNQQVICWHKSSAGSWVCVPWLGRRSASTDRTRRDKYQPVIHAWTGAINCSTSTCNSKHCKHCQHLSVSVAKTLLGLERCLHRRLRFWLRIKWAHSVSTFVLLADESCMGTRLTRLLSQAHSSHSLCSRVHARVRVHLCTASQ